MRAVNPSVAHRALQWPSHSNGGPLANDQQTTAGGAMAKARPLTSHDLARLAGVSQSTVSRVLAGNPHVRPETRERVLRVFEEQDYEPNALARAMKTGRTDTVGVFMTRVRSPFHAALLDAICRKLADSRLHMTLWNLEHDSPEFAAQAPHRNLVDGFMFTSALEHSKVERAAVRSGIPLVLVHRGVEDLACDQVLGDNRAGAHEAATYLARAGHTRIGLVTTGNREASNIRDREDGFRAGLEQAGVELPQELVVLADGPVHIPGGAEHRSGHAAVRHLMSLDDPPSAIFAVTDLQAFGVLDGARSLGISVPEQLWVIGFDDVEMSSWESFDLTTVRQPTENLVATAIELLQRRLIDPSQEPKVVTHPCPLIVRGSTGNTTNPTN